MIKVKKKETKMKVARNVISSLMFQEDPEASVALSLSDSQPFVVITRNRIDLRSGEIVGLVFLEKKTIFTIFGFAELSCMRTTPLGSIMPSEWAMHVGLRDKPLFAQYMTQLCGMEIDDGCIFHITRFRVIHLYKHDIAIIKKTWKGA